MKSTCKLVKKVSVLLKKINCREFLHHLGPKKYKFKQHAAALLLKEICKTSFRRVVQIFDLFDVAVPTYSALCKSRKRIPAWIWQQLLSITAGLQNEIAAIDATGFSRTNPSHHYLVRGCKEGYRKGYAKISALYDVKSHKVMAIHVRIRPAHEIRDAKILLRSHKPTYLLGDKAYDAEWLHQYCFERKIKTIIPSKVWTKKGFYRRKQKINYSEEKYHQRSLIESGFSAIKRKYGSAVSGKSLASIRTEASCKAIAHNLKFS